MLAAIYASLALAAGVALAFAPPAGAQPPLDGAPTVLDGPSATIVRPAGLGVSIARDGTGGLVYVKTVGGTAHVFVSRLVGGSFTTPSQVDVGLSGASSQPVIAAGEDGLLLVAFINSDQLYVVDGNQRGQFGMPQWLTGGAVNPALSISPLGKAYLAFAAADGAGYDIRTAYYANGQWSLETPPLNAVAADEAGIGLERPRVAAAGDGIGIVAWGEQTPGSTTAHIYTRRVWGTSPSVALEQADGALSGCTESSVDQPVLGAGGNSSYVPVVFHEVMVCAGQQQSRVVMNRLHGSVYDGVRAADGLSSSSADGADDPQIAVSEYGQGWVTSSGTSSDDVFGASLGNNGVPAGGAQAINSLAEWVSPFQVAAINGYHANFIAWQQQPGASPGGDIRLRWAGDGVTLGPERILSLPAQGPVDAADGLAAAGDIAGNAAVAWLQGGPGATQLMVAQLYQPPGGFSAANSFAYSRVTQPEIAWHRPSGWGPMQYAVSIDGTQIGQTFSTSTQVPPLPDGPHSWRVTASNPAGQQSSSRAAFLFVDTTAPFAALRAPSRAAIGSPIRVKARYADRPPAGQPAQDASGVAAVTVRWGDGSVTQLLPGRHVLTHLYRHIGSFVIVLRVVDHAGNVTRVTAVVKVVKPKPKRAAKTHTHR